MTSPTEQRRSFDTAMEHYRRGEFDRARAIFTEITAASPLMSDAWLGRMACGDHNIDTLAGRASEFPGAVSRDPPHRPGSRRPARAARRTDVSESARLVTGDHRLWPTPRR